MFSNTGLLFQSRKATENQKRLCEDSNLKTVTFAISRKRLKPLFPEMPVKSQRPLDSAPPHDLE
jgi:hypothetical protein